MVVFQDTQIITSKSMALLRDEVMLPSAFRKLTKLQDPGQLREAYHSGALVNIFDLLEQLAKPSYNVSHNAVALKVLESLKIGALVEQELKNQLSSKDYVFEQLRMKLTAKVAKHGFDLRYFFETLDFQG